MLHSCCINDALTSFLALSTDSSTQCVLMYSSDNCDSVSAGAVVAPTVDELWPDANLASDDKLLQSDDEEERHQLSSAFCVQLFSDEKQCSVPLVLTL